jgi:hypothetical protein
MECGRLERMKTAWKRYEEPHGKSSDAHLNDRRMNHRAHDPMQHACPATRNFRGLRLRVASETDLADSSRLLGHTKNQITWTAHQQVDETSVPTK